MHGVGTEMPIAGDLTTLPESFERETTLPPRSADWVINASDRSRPRVSVVMPFLNTPAPFITEAVESVLGQTFTDWELILANDGSGPATLEVAHALAARDARVRCISHDGGVNRGIPATRNLGITNAHGDLLAFLDSDDVWYPKKLEEQLQILDAAPDVDMVFGRSVYWRAWSADGDQRDRLPLLGVRDRTVFPRGDFLRKVLRAQIMVPCPSSILVRTSAVRAVGGFQANVSNLYEDQGFYAKVSLAGVVMACNEVWDRYRLHSASVIGSATRREAAEARRQYLDWLTTYLDETDIENRRLRRAVRVERWVAGIPYGPRLLRSVRRLAAFPGRLVQRLHISETAGRIAR